MGFVSTTPLPFMGLSMCRFSSGSHEAQPFVVYLGRLANWAVLSSSHHVSGFLYFIAVTSLNIHLTCYLRYKACDSVVYT